MPFELNAITFYYSDKKVIDNLSIRLEPAKFYGIVGPNGSGKTTILDMLAGHRQPVAGNTTSCPRHCRIRHIVAADPGHGWHLRV